MMIGRRKFEFSVVIPLYNKEKSIPSTIKSVLDQSYPYFELIVVNDGSTDKSQEKVRQFNDSRIKLFNKPNGGVSSARNYGISKSIHDIVIFLDADDIWFPNCLDEFTLLMDRYPHASVFATNLNITGKNVIGSESRYIVSDFYYQSAVLMAKWNLPLMVTGCVAIRKECFNKVGMFNTAFTHGEDIDLWNRLTKQCSIAKSEVVTTLYRLDADNRASNIPGDKQKFPDKVNITKKQVKNKSLQLYYGCQFLTNFHANLKNYKNIKYSIQYLKYWDWMIRAALLYSKYRLFYFDKNKAGGKTFLF